MGQVTSNPASTTFVQAYNTYGWASLNSNLLKPQVKQQMYRENGAGERMLDFLRWGNAEYDMKARSLSVLSKGQRERVFTSTGTVATGSAGAAISITATPDNSGTINGFHVQAGDTFIVPAAYQTTGVDKEYYVTAVTGTTTKTVTASPLSSTGQISATIPIGTEFVVGGSKHGWGTGQPSSKVDVVYNRTYTAELSKETFSVEGGIDALEWWVQNDESGAGTGRNGVMFIGQEDLEFRLDRQLDFKLFFSEPNTNSLTATSQFGGDNALPSTKGLWQWGKEEGMSQTYGGAYTIDYVYDLKDYLRSKNITTRELMFGYGCDLGRQLEEAVKDEIRAYSGGTDLFVNAGTYGISVNTIKVNGLTVALKEFDSFSNPTKFGNNDLNYRQSGIVMPVGVEKVTIGGVSSIEPMIQIGYARNNGVDRSRVFSFQDGMSGTTSNGVNQYDGYNAYLLSEHTTIVHNPQSLILVEKA